MTSFLDFVHLSICWSRKNNIITRSILYRKRL